MRTTPGLWLVAVLAALLPALPAAASAQGASVPDGAPAPGTAGERGDGRIEGFWGLAWGVDSATVVEELGPPLSVSRADGDARVFAYTPLFLGRDGFLFLRLSGGRGLVGGSWEPMTSDCTVMLRRLVRKMKRRHPEVPFRTEGDVGGGLERDLCVAAMEDGVRLEVRWEDAVGNRLRVVATPDRPALRMLGSAAPADSGG